MGGLADQESCKSVRGCTPVTATKGPGSLSKFIRLCVCERERERESLKETLALRG